MRARVFVGTRHSPALCYLCVCSSRPPPWLFVCSNPRNSVVGDVARHGNILAFLVAVCGLSTIRLHAAAYLLFPFAPFRLLHKRACGWAVGTSRLRSVAWQHTWTPLVTCVCLVFFFFFFFFVVLCFTSVVLLFLSVCPFIPCCSSVAVMALRRSGHARAGIPFFPHASGGEHRRSFGATSCWFSLPVRFSLRFSWRRTLALLITLLVLRLLRRCAHGTRHITYLLSGGRWRCCCLCVFFMHDIQHTWVHVRPLALFVVIPFARISYMSGLALLGRVLVVYLHRGAVRYLFILLVYLFPRCACFVGFSRCAAHNILACRRLVALLLSMCGLFWGAHKSLAPRARTLLGGLGQATLSFFAVATLLFVFFGECPIFCDLPKQRRKIVGGVSEVGKDDFSLYFCWRCVFFS